MSMDIMLNIQYYNIYKIVFKFKVIICEALSSDKACNFVGIMSTAEL